MDNENSTETETPTRTFTELQEELSRWQTKANDAEERLDYHAKRQEQQRQRRALDTQLREARHELQARAMADALSHYASDLPQFDNTHPDVAKLVQGAIKIARLRGTWNEATRALEHLPREITQFDEIRNDDAISARMLEPQEARENMVALIVTNTLRSLEHHPRDPRFLEVWKSVVIEATSATLCPEFDALAQLLEIPTDMEIEYSGYVDSSGSWSSRTYIEGTTTRQDILNGYVGDDVDNSDTIEMETHETDLDLSFS